MLLLSSNYLVKRVKAKDRLKILNRFFIRTRWFSCSIFDSTTAQFCKPVAWFSRSICSSLLEISVRSSAADGDDFLHDVSIELMDMPIAAQISALASIPNLISSKNAYYEWHLTEFEAVDLSYNLKWSVKFIVSPMDITNYQLMFRYLFYSKHVEKV